MKIKLIESPEDFVIRVIDEEVINEISADAAYDKFYTNIKREIYDELLNLDPTYKNNQIGKYFKWIVKIFNNEEINKQNSEEVKEALITFETHKSKLDNKDINNYKTLNDLLVLTKPLANKSNDFKIFDDINKWIKKNIFNSALRQRLTDAIQNQNYLDTFKPLYDEIIRMDKETQKVYSKKTSRPDLEDANNFLTYTKNFIQDVGSGFTFKNISKKIESLNEGILIRHSDEEQQSIIVKVNTFEASQAIGSTQWCISYNKEHWDSYVTIPDNNMFFIFNFNLQGIDPLSSMGIAMTLDNKINAAHDKFDNVVNENVVWKEIKKMGLRETLIKINVREKGIKTHDKKITIDVYPSQFSAEDIRLKRDIPKSKDKPKIKSKGNFDGYYHALMNLLKTLKKDNKTKGDNIDLILDKYQNWKQEFNLQPNRNGQTVNTITKTYNLFPILIRRGMDWINHSRMMDTYNDFGDKDKFIKQLVYLYFNYNSHLNNESKRELLHTIKDNGVDILKLSKQVKDRIGKNLSPTEFSMANKRGDINLKPIVNNKMNKITKGEHVNITNPEIVFAINNGYEKFWHKYYQRKLNTIDDFPVDYDELQIYKKLDLMDSLNTAILTKGNNWGIDSLNSIEKSIYDYANP